MTNHSFFGHPLTWLFVTLVLLGACTFLPLRIKNDYLRNWVMRWVLVPVSILLMVYAYPVGIDVFRRLASHS